MALDIIVMVSAVISIFQCVRSIISSWHLQREVTSFFNKKFLYRLKCHQILPLYNMWFLLVIVSNMLVLVGSLLKLLIAYDVSWRGRGRGWGLTTLSVGGVGARLSN